MFKLFRTDRTERLLQAIERGDTEQLAKLLPRTAPETLTGPLRDGCHAAELAVRLGQTKALSLLLEAGAMADARDRDGRPLLHLALAHPEQSLALLDALLRGGADPNEAGNGHPCAVFACFDYCEPDRLMLHLSRLIQAGARLDARDAAGLGLAERALVTRRRDLIHFLIHSGVPLPDVPPADLDTETWHYAQKCAQDLLIRQQFLAP